ncbi:MAG: SHOCT domain-containing protein [Coriobacteriia bacterium]|nr:SHOCT domain-containing protein [Coriobacteriia bacterium]
MMFLWLPFLLLIPFGIFWMIRRGEGIGCCGMNHAEHTRTPNAGGPDPIEIARRRLARGEITTAEFEEIRRIIA